MQSFTFSHLGAEIPALGFGTFQIPPEITEAAVKQALQLGYRHIDTAQIYGNEAQVGSAIKHSGLLRKDIFLTTKVWITHYEPQDLKASVQESLQKLKTDYVDLLLLHWPNPTVPLQETVAALNEVKAMGLTHHIGISNFTVKLMQQAVAYSKAPLFTNQVEYHPYLSQEAVLQAAKANNILVTAYSPLARGKIVHDPVLIHIAAKYAKKPSQIALRWLFQQNVVSIPKAISLEHAQDNLNIFDFSLDSEDMLSITTLARVDGRMINPVQLAPDWD